MYRENCRNKKARNKNRFFIKALLCIIGMIVLVFVAFRYNNYRLKENKVPYIQIKEVVPFLEALITVNENDITEEERNEITGLRNLFIAEQNIKERNLSFGELQKILQIFPISDENVISGYKSDSWDIGIKDWNQIVEMLVQTYGEGQIVVREMVLLGTTEQVSDEKKIPVERNRIYTDIGLLRNRFVNSSDYLFSNVKAVCYKDSLLTVTGYAKEKGLLHNVYFSAVANGKNHFFYKGYHMAYPVEQFAATDKKYKDGDTVNIITDITFDKGKIRIQGEKGDYVHGKLLRVGENSIEIEGYDKFQIDENMQIYKVFGVLESGERKDLRIGYSFSDFVVEDGKIVACLMIKEEDMAYIRVLLKNSDMADKYHEMVSGYCNQDCEWIEYEEGVEKERRRIPQGEKFSIKKEDIERSGKRIKIIPSVLSGKITLDSMSRSSGIPSYSGSLEITGDGEGLLVINEVLLEDYLCKVVPSEMPSSYPKEALMAQAICARTYAYGKMLNAGLPELGAHVDDSAGFQVYNNISEQASTTEAVKATHNTIAEYDNEPIGAYYYSTSCGMGSDTGVWHGTSESPAYLQAKEIGMNDENDNGILFTDVEISPHSLIEEDAFEKWITDVKDSHYESKEGWYRWSYEVNKIDVSCMEEVLQTRYTANPNLILTWKDGEYRTQEITGLGEVVDMEIVKRLPGGVADELVITGTKATVKVISELNIRYVLADGVTKVVRQTEDEVEAPVTLPSAFIMLETKKERDMVSGYRITGGGFGHGVGMSQNGAKNMANTGKTCEEILTFFYPGVTLKTLQSEDVS